MKSTRCWLTSGLLLGLARFGQAFDYDENSQQFNGNADEQGQAVQNSWPSDDIGYGNQDGYELSVQPNYYDQQLEQEADPNQIQQYSDYIDELQNLQNIMEQGYGANQDYETYLSRNNGPSDYSDPNTDSNIDYNIDYNGLDYPASDSSTTSGQETYPSPPNPCPKGLKVRKNDCIPNMPDTAEFSQMYQAINKNGEGSKMNADMLNSFFQTV